MRRTALRAVAALTVCLAAAGAVTWIALEQDGVAVLLTRRPDGSLRATRVWAVDVGGSPWIEAASPERPWLRDVEIEPTVGLSRADGRPAPYRAVPVPDAAAHARLRAALRERYGWRDAWVTLLQDTSRGVAVRLEPLPPAPPGPS